MSADPSSPGQQLREAREAMGKDLKEMAERTRIKTQQLEGLETDNYDRIPAPTYVKGFMKLYARELGLNPDRLVEQYERIRTGDTGEVTPGPEPLAEPEQTSPPVSGTPAGEEPHPPIWSQWMDSWLAEGVTHPRVWGPAAAGVFLVLILIGFKSCSGPDTEDLKLEDLPPVEHPLLHEPGPVYFELPRSVQ